MEICVIIPSYNDRSVITRAVKSAVIDNVAAEVVVVDDGSTDGTASVVMGLNAPRVRVISQSNGGPSSARNAGLANAMADVVVFLDADDILLPGALTVFLDAHVRSQNLLTRTGAVIDDGFDAPRFAEPSPYPYPRGTPLAGTFSVSRQLLQEANGYDDKFRYGENSELLYRLMTLVGPSNVSYVREPTVQTVSRVGRSYNFYDDARLESARRMIDLYGGSLKNDRETLANHHAIASVLSRSSGNRSQAVRHAAKAFWLEPHRWRHWARVGRLLLPG
ncbi:MAG: glycosyltransferase family 2 protein [Microthrixaceae bacterium]|nr:glycosyltransferase family 2 protein [Microthrixaceae bacterium]